MARRDVTGGAVHYYFYDHLGSSAVVENATGSSCEQDIDYYPYGGVVNDYCGTVTQHYRYNGKEADSESGLDNFDARYQDPPLGRFMTPDWAGKPWRLRSAWLCSQWLRCFEMGPRCCLPAEFAKIPTSPTIREKWSTRVIFRISAYKQNTRSLHAPRAGCASPAAWSG